jgi:hypothetical protein
MPGLQSVAQPRWEPWQHAHLGQPESPALQAARHPARHPPQGAATSIYAAVTPGLEAQSGCYLADCAAAQPKLPKDPEAASKLWAATEALLAEKNKA